MKILHISAECYPIAKVGGLADVVGSLPKYLNQAGVECAVIIPFYNNAFTSKNSFKEVFTGTLYLGEEKIDFNILKLIKRKLGYEVWFVDIPTLLFTDYVYSHDDTKRFISFQIAVLEWVKNLDNPPEIFHCHDHHTGLIPFMLSHCYDYKSLREVPSVFTIHNAVYQGWFPHDLQYLIPEFNYDHVGLLDWDQSINSLATGIKCAWRVTTVSPNYLEELKLDANGLETLIQMESTKCSGILNGIDTKVWDPETDPYLEMNYSVETLESGKEANKSCLCKKFDLDPTLPLFVFIGRLVGEKGADLFPEFVKTAMEDPNYAILILGSGNEDLGNQLGKLTNEFPGFYNAFIGYDESLSHKMYAGADFLFMPSRVEPCGLNQMYALRYGTIPIVSKVGGLMDTVVDIDIGGQGLQLNEINVNSMLTTNQRAVDLYNSNTFMATRISNMKIDHSWTASANKYIDLYNSLL